MHISTSTEVEGRRVLSSIGRIEAASDWKASASGRTAEDAKTVALRRLLRAAEDCDADAVVEVNYAFDDLRSDDVAGPLKRVCVKGVAVRLSHG